MNRTRSPSRAVEPVVRARYRTDGGAKRVVRAWAMAKLACLLLAFGCSGKPERAPVVVEDAPRVDAAPLVDARPPFAVMRRDASLQLTPHDATCPEIEWRAEPRMLRIGRCRETPFADQVSTLREMVAYLRTLDHVGDDLRIVGIGDHVSYPELARRFVTYAKTHPYTPKAGLHAWIQQAANSGDMMPELAVIFQRKPILSSVEKCSTGRASHKNELGKLIREAGGTGNAEIPLGCAMTTFALAPL